MGKRWRTAKVQIGELLVRKFLKHSACITFVVIAICIGALFAHRGGTLTRDLMVSFVSGAVFWILACWLPDLARKSLIRNTLNWQYHEFKRVVIDILCAAIGAQMTEAEKMKFYDCEYFSNYFGSNNEHGDRIDVAMSGLDH